MGREEGVVGNRLRDGGEGFERDGREAGKRDRSNAIPL